MTQPLKGHLPIVTYATDWGGNKIPLARVRCMTCGDDYAVSPDYDTEEPCPFCQSPVVKAIFVDVNA